MNQQQKDQLRYHRRREIALVGDLLRELGRIDVTKMTREQFEAWRPIAELVGAIDWNREEILSLVGAAHCGDCGAHESEPCAETCNERVTEGT